MPTLARRSRPTKLYNIEEVARRLGVHRQTVKYWLDKGWVRPTYLYSGFAAAFTAQDISRLKKWKALPLRERRP